MFKHDYHGKTFARSTTLYLLVTVVNFICFAEIFTKGEWWRQAAVAAFAATIWFIYSQGSVVQRAQRGLN